LEISFVYKKTRKTDFVNVVRPVLMTNGTRTTSDCTKAWHRRRGYVHLRQVGMEFVHFHRFKKKSRPFGRRFSRKNIPLGGGEILGQ